MDKIKFLGDGQDNNANEVHLRSPINDYTICGYTLDGDIWTAGSYINTNEKINCVHCIEIIKACKSVKF